MVVIAAHYYRGLLAYELDDLSGIRPVVYQIPEDPKAIVIGRQGVDGLQICVKIRNDQSLTILQRSGVLLYYLIRRWSSPNRRSPSGQ
jgi:hypothetical protein